MAADFPGSFINTSLDILSELSLDVAKENELILDDNTTYYYVSIHDAKNVVISSKVFKK